MPVANTAVRIYHRNSPEAARQYLNSAFDTSTYWGPTGRASARGWANSIRTYFDNYMNLAERDDRGALAMTVTSDVQFGDHAIGVKLDVVLLDEDGYVARIPLWEKDPLDQSVMETLSGPIVEALAIELGATRAVGVDFWHLRSSVTTHVTAATARGRTSAATDAIDRYEGGAD